MATLPKNNDSSIRPCITEDGAAYTGIYIVTNDDTFASINSISKLKSAANAFSQALNSNILIYRHDLSQLTTSCLSAHRSTSASFAIGTDHETAFPERTLPSDIIFMYIAVTTSNTTVLFIDLTSAHVLASKSGIFTYTLTTTKFNSILQSINVTLPDGNANLGFINNTSSGDLPNYRLLRRRASFTRFKANSGVTYNTDRGTLFAAAIDSMNNLAKSSIFLTEQNQSTEDNSLYEKLELMQAKLDPESNIGISKTDFDNIVENIMDKNYNNLSTSERLLYDFIIKLNNNN